MRLTRIKKLIFLHLQHLPMKSKGWRSRICKLGGVNILEPQHTFIGEGVIFDTNYPEDITIESGVTIATRSWCKSADYWTVAGYMNHEVYQKLRESGYMFPFNKLDVVIKQ